MTLLWQSRASSTPSPVDTDAVFKEAKRRQRRRRLRVAGVVLLVGIIAAVTYAASSGDGPRVPKRPAPRSVPAPTAVTPTWSQTPVGQATLMNSSLVALPASS
jgi:hypothetical protein